MSLLQTETCPPHMPKIVNKSQQNPVQSRAGLLKTDDGRECAADVHSLRVMRGDNTAFLNSISDKIM
jgi:hypothetical protein